MARPPNGKKMDGGMEPLQTLRESDFLYTDDLSRKLWTLHFYPYSEWLLNTVREIPWKTYQYKGLGVYTGENGEFNTLESFTKTAPSYWFLGGTAYELLGKKYPKSPSLRRFVDPTADIDVQVLPPKIENSENDMSGLLYYDSNSQPGLYYDHFTNWIVKEFHDRLMKQEPFFHKAFGSLMSFEDSEYDEVPIQSVPVGKMKIMTVLNDKQMFKIQLVAKIHVNGRDILDHVLEMVIPLPEAGIEYAPNGDDYDPDSYRQSIHLSSPKNTYFIAKIDSLLRGNVEAYIARKPYFKEFPYKVLNHVVRIVYLMEWLSQHSDSKVWKTLGSLYIMNRKAKDDFLFLKNQTLPLAELLNAYQNLYVDAEKKQWYQPSNGRTYTHKNLFIEPFPDSETMKKRHEDFLEKYFPVRSSRTKSLKKSLKKGSLKKGSLKKGTRSVKKKAKSATAGHQSKTRHHRREILTH